MNERFLSYLLHSKRFFLAYVFFFAIKEISCDAAERGTVKRWQESFYEKWQAKRLPLAAKWILAFNLLKGGFYFLFEADKYSFYAVVFPGSVAFS